MRHGVWAGATALAMTAMTTTALAAAPAAAVVTTPAAVHAAKSDTIPKVKVRNQGTQVMISDSKFRPGVVQFKVGKTYTLPGPQGGPETITIVRTDQFDELMSILPALFSADPSDPASLQAAAAAMRKFRQISTVYGGANQGGKWQVSLPKGNYYAFQPQSAAMGITKPAQFTVSGKSRGGQLHATNAEIDAVTVNGGNAWKTHGLKHLDKGWLTFANKTKEVHFMDLQGVKPNTTNKMVRQSFKSPNPPTFGTNKHFSFDVVSPKVTVAISAPIKTSKYLLACFMPSETDGLPHAFMGMWKLVDID